MRPESIRVAPLCVIIPTDGTATLTECGDRETVSLVIGVICGVFIEIFVVFWIG